MFIYDYNFVRIGIVVETELKLLDKFRFWIVGRYIVIDSLVKVKCEVWIFFWYIKYFFISLEDIRFENE